MSWSSLCFHNPSAVQRPLADLHLPAKIVIIGKSRNGARGPIPARSNRSDLRFYAPENLRP